LSDQHHQDNLLDHHQENLSDQHQDNLSDHHQENLSDHQDNLLDHHQDNLLDYHQENLSDQHQENLLDHQENLSDHQENLLDQLKIICRINIKIICQISIKKIHQTSIKGTTKRILWNNFIIWLEKLPKRKKKILKDSSIGANPKEQENTGNWVDLWNHHKEAEKPLKDGELVPSPIRTPVHGPRSSRNQFPLY